jgi:16S rRNA processing protein RimM
VATEPHSDVPDRFRPGMRLWALPKDGDGPRRELTIEELWPHKGHLVLRFEGIDSISDAETLIGNELQVPASERSKLEPGWVYVSDLVGCVVFDGDREVGLVQDVQFGAGEAPLLIVKAGANQYEIPYAEAYLKSTDFERKKVSMMLPEGMLELNAPLTADEKEQQKNSRKPSS